jgi:hypothetical protein
MKKVLIYALICPKAKEIRYIGKTIQSLKSRLKGHLYIPKNDTTYRANWIRDLRKDKLIPEIILIEECNESNWVEREIYWIDYYSKLVNLVNYSKGGNGGHHVKISTREKLSNLYKEKWTDSEYRNKMSTMSKNMWKDKNRKELASNRIKNYWTDSEYRNKMSTMSKDMWKDEVYRETRLTSDSKEKIRQSRLNSITSEKTKEKIGKKAKELWVINKEKWIKTRFKKPIIVDNKLFESIEEASKFLELDASTVSRRVKSEKFPNYSLHQEGN